MTTFDLPPGTICSLDADGMAIRATAFREILAPNLRGLHRRGADARLELALDHAQEREPERLLDLERACCPFWRFSLQRFDEGHVVTRGTP